MKMKASLITFLFIPILASAQYEQNISLTISAGAFNTFGNRIGELGPMQMPNYELGLSANGGIQFRINEQFSLSAEFGIMLTQRWFYADGDNNNYHYWSLYDTLSNELLAEGENYLDFINYSIGIEPKYYLLKNGKWNPYLFAGVNINLTYAYFEDQGWIERDKRGLLPLDDTGPDNDYLEKNIGIGVNPGIGVEYRISKRSNLHLTTGYYFIGLNKENFKNPLREENFNAWNLQVGARIFIKKTKEL